MVGLLGSTKTFVLEGGGKRRNCSSGRMSAGLRDRSTHALLATGHSLPSRHSCRLRQGGQVVYLRTAVLSYDYFKKRAKVINIYIRAGHHLTSPHSLSSGKEEG